MSNKQQFENMIINLLPEECVAFWEIGGSIALVSACQQTNSLNIFLNKLQNINIKQNILNTQLLDRDNSELNRNLFIQHYHNSSFLHS